MVDVNLVGTFNLWREGLAGVQDAGGAGRLIAVASMASLKGYPYVAGYVAAKHAVLGLVRALSLELAGTGATVNAICPGFTETPMLAESVANIVAKTGRSPAEAQKALSSGNPQGRFIAPSEIAQTTLWLCSDAARSVNGQPSRSQAGKADTHDIHHGTGDSQALQAAYREPHRARLSRPAGAQEPAHVRQLRGAARLVPRARLRR